MNIFFFYQLLHLISQVAHDKVEDPVVDAPVVVVEAVELALGLDVALFVLLFVEVLVELLELEVVWYCPAAHEKEHAPFTSKYGEVQEEHPDAVQVLQSIKNL